MKKNYKPLVVSLAASLGLGGISALILGSKTKEFYMSLAKPPLSPPSIVFPIVWSILYILMGISAYLIYKSSCRGRNKALYIYALQLIMNFIWTMLFFKLQLLFVSFI